MAVDPSNIHPATHWFVPLKQLDSETGTPLQRADIRPSESDGLVNAGDSFLITLESLLIVDKYDRKSDNDLLVRSRLKYGNDPRLEAINLFENDVPAGTVRTNLLCEHIFSQAAYSTLNRVHLEVEVMELKGDISLNREIASGLKAIKNTFGVVSSALLPFGGVAFDVMERLNAVRSERRRIFFSTLDLYGEGGEGEARLRYGAYVFFKEPLEGSKYRLHKLQVKHPDSTQTFSHDYIVVKVVPNLIRVGSDEELLLKSQKLSTALGSANGQPDRTARHPNFDRDSIPDTEKLRNLAIFYSLQKQKDAQSVLDDAQTRLYQKLRQELQDFVS